MPSLIAYLQLGHETDCIGKCASPLWSRLLCNAEFLKQVATSVPTLSLKHQTACVSYALGISMRTSMQLCAGWWMLTGVLQGRIPNPILKMRWSLPREV